jgi:hypothetical protein
LGCCLEFEGILTLDIPRDGASTEEHYFGIGAQPVNQGRKSKKSAALRACASARLEVSEVIPGDHNRGGSVSLKAADQRAKRANKAKQTHRQLH